MRLRRIAKEEFSAELSNKAAQVLVQTRAD